MEGRCPDTYYCSNGSQPYSDIKPSLLFIPAYASLVTSSLSCLGAVLIVFAYCAFKDLRKGTAQTIITLLALADLGTAVAGIFGGSLFIGYLNLDEKSEGECYIFDTVCQIQGFMGLWAYQSSLFWTSILAIHFFLITIFHHYTWTDKLLPLYNIIAWIVPLATTLSLLVLDKIGYNYYLIWTCLLRLQEKINYITGVWWIPEVLATSLMILGYTLTLMYIACKQVCTLYRYMYTHTYIHIYIHMYYIRSYVHTYRDECNVLPYIFGNEKFIIILFTMSTVSGKRLSSLTIRLHRCHTFIDKSL